MMHYRLWYTKEKIRRLFQKPKDLPRKLYDDEFGGGRVKGIYFNGELWDLKCSRAHCHRQAEASWAGCADENILRPLCYECDVWLNWMVQKWWGDPAYRNKIRKYIRDIENDIERSLDLPRDMLRDIGYDAGSS